jgi:hypothetical protein
MLKTVIVVIFTGLIISSGTYGQTPNRDEVGCATKEGQELSFLVGDWKVRSKFRTGSNPDKWEETNGTSSFKFLFDKCLLREKLSIRRGDRPLTVLAMYSYNNISRNYQWMFAHSEHGVLSLFEGPLTGNKFTLKNSLEVGGRKFLFERRLTKTRNGFELIAKRSFDNGKTWRNDWFLNYYRKKEKAGAGLQPARDH